MKPRASILEAVARRYERSQAGRTGVATRDTLIPLEELLAEAGASEGDTRAVAEQQLAAAEAAGVLERVPLHPRDPAHIHQIRISPANEPLLYARLGRPSPAQQRLELAEQFNAAAALDVPARFQEPWRRWCARMRDAAAAGRSTAPLDRLPSPANRELLELVPKLLAWERESLVRFASCVLCQDSKRLETLATLEREGESAGRLRGKLGRLLEDITEGEVRALDDLGILPTPRSALVHGPLKLRLRGEWVNLGLLLGPTRLSQIDIQRAEAIDATSPRCLTVENETTFHELAQLQSGVLLVCTSYPGSATVTLLRRLPDHLEYWHFGDSDDAGFEILRVLRAKTGRAVRPLHMEAGRSPFEQEALGRPSRPDWPFYG